jgi:hypothetical protein
VTTPEARGAARYGFTMPMDLGPVVRAVRASRERRDSVRPRGGVREIPSRAVVTPILLGRANVVPA